MNEQLLQTLDGLPLARSTEHVRCSGCNIRLREGTEVLAHVHLDEYWKPDGVYCPDCYADEEIEASSDKEQAVTEGRVIVRQDHATQSTNPALQTLDYNILTHSPADEVTTGGGEGQDSRVSRQELIDELQRLADEGTPTADDLREQGQYPYVAYRNEFGSWTAALEAAGVTSDDDPDRDNTIGVWDE